jgi:hypothetical protein
MSGANENSNLKEIIGAIAKDPTAEIYSIVGVVDSVDEEARTVDVSPISGDAAINDVRLQADIDSTTGVVIIPKLESNVVVTFLNQKTGFVSLCTDVDKLLINTDIVTINGGENGGLTITPELKTQLDKTNELLTGLINVLNGTPIPEPGNGAPSALQTALSTAITGKQLGEFDNIENEKVKH